METRSHTPVKATPTPSFTAVRGGLLQRKCACGGSAGLVGECEECGKQRLSLQRSTLNSERETRNSGGVPPIVQDVLRSPGQPLDLDTRAFFEPRFGHDFGDVRVHTDSSAAESARAVNAFAYTVGRHIVFEGGLYAPSTRSGRELIAHELTHTIQQGQADSPVSEIGQPADSSEHEASQAAEKVTSGAAGPLPVLVNGTSMIRRQDVGNGAASAASTAETDNVTAEDARRALIARIGEEAYRLLEQRLLGNIQPGESEAESAGSIVAGGGVAPRVSRLAAAPTLQAAGPLLPIAGALAAMALCAYGFYFYALENFPGKDDKWLHCWTSCKIAAWCGGPSPGPGPGSVLALLLGLGKEVLDAICDALGEPCNAEWEDVFADVKGIGCAAVPLWPCSDCCDASV